MRIRVTTLTENTTTRNGTLAEHGLSMLVEVDDFPILLDTGQTTTTVHNARVLGVDLSRVHHIVLSHGHQDHAGGLMDVLARTDGVWVYAHTDVWRPRYAVQGVDKYRYNGVPFVREQLESMGAAFDLSDGPATIAPGVMTTGYIPRKSGFEKLDSNQKVRTPLGWEQDAIPDDQALLVKTPVSHCTGLVASARLAHEFGHRFFFNNVGTVTEWDL